MSYSLLQIRDISALRAALPDAEYYVPPDETIQLELSRGIRGTCNLIHHASQFKADIYLAGRDPLHAWALAYRRRISLEGGGAWTPEYVIVRKLEYLREGGQDKHVRDIRFILAATATDNAFLEAEIARLGLREQWGRCIRQST